MPIDCWTQEVLPFLKMAASPGKPCAGFIISKSFASFEKITTYCFSHNIDHYNDFHQKFLYQIFIFSFDHALEIMKFAHKLNLDVSFVNNLKH